MVKGLCSIRMERFTKVHSNLIRDTGMVYATSRIQESSIVETGEKI